MPSEGSGTRMGAGVLDEDLSTPVLSFVQARGPDPGTTCYRHAALGCGAGSDGFGCQTRRAVV